MCRLGGAQLRQCLLLAGCTVRGVSDIRGLGQTDEGMGRRREDGDPSGLNTPPN